MTKKTVYFYNQTNLREECKYPNLRNISFKKKRLSNRKKLYNRVALSRVTTIETNTILIKKIKTTIIVCNNNNNPLIIMTHKYKHHSRPILSQSPKINLIINRKIKILVDITKNHNKGLEN